MWERKEKEKKLVNNKGKGSGETEKQNGSKMEVKENKQRKKKSYFDPGEKNILLSTAAVVTLMHASVTVYIHYLSCYVFRYQTGRQRS